MNQTGSNEIVVDGVIYDLQELEKHMIPTSWIKK
jgi:hypothetical protein